MDVVDVFVYLVVLGLFVQFFPAVISESFVISLLTAVLLKAVLEVIVRVKKFVLARIRTARRPFLRLVASLALVAVSAASKFAVLMLTELLFGDAVYLGGFIPVTLLILVLMAARSRVRLLFGPEERPGEHAVLRQPVPRSGGAAGGP